MNIRIKLNSETSRIPTKNSPDEAGYDLYSAEDCIVKPMERKLVKTGISISIPYGFYGHISDRSGMALKKGAHCLGKIVDPTYRGEIGVIILNTDMFEPIKIQKGDRIAQIIFKRYENVDFIIENRLDDSTRGEKGFGSSGN
jgi:dUTP pyrophosphatase